MIFDTEQWNIFVKGFHVVDGAIGFENTRYCFVLEETKRNIHRDPPPMIRLLFVRMERPLERRLYSIDFTPFEFPRVAAATVDRTPQFIIADMDGNTIVYDDAVENIQPESSGIPLRWGKQQGAALRKLKQLNHKLYALCSDRLLLQRAGYDKWNAVAGLERPAQRIADMHASNIPYGFNDMDAFNPEEMYAAGGKGDVWHFDGAAWRSCKFPSDESLKTVCCGGDGMVYITSVHGKIWRGKQDAWEQLPSGRNSAYNDTVWFAGKLWMAHDAGLETLTDNGPAPADVDPQIHRSARRLNLSEDKSRLLSAGQHGASLFDGKEWQLLFISPEKTK